MEILSTFNNKTKLQNILDKYKDNTNIHKLLLEMVNDNLISLNNNLIIKLNDNNKNICNKQNNNKIIKRKNNNIIAKKDSEDNIDLK